MKDPRAYYDLFSRRYEEGRDHGYHALIDDLEVEIALPFARGARVLEAGCGTGRILSRLAPVAARAVGADLSRGMLQGSVRRGLRVVQAQVGALPFPDASFDLVCSYKVLAHVPEIGAALAELTRVLRPGGHLLLEFYNPLSLRYLGKRLKRPSAVGEGATDVDVYTRYDTPWRIRELLPAGIRLLDFRGVRVVTPFSHVHRLPVVGRLFSSAERACVRSPLRYFGGFLVALAVRER